MFTKAAGIEWHWPCNTKVLCTCSNPACSPTYCSYLFTYTVFYLSNGKYTLLHLYWNLVIKAMQLTTGPYPFYVLFQSYLSKSCMTVINYISNNISSSQFGFMKNWSTLKQMLVFLNNICENDKAQIYVIYLDFTEAFDWVPHNKLLLKFIIGIAISVFI